MSRPRVLVSTDIGGTDPDDFQSLVHLLLYADRLDLEGLVSSPYGDGRVADLHTVLDHYAADHASLAAHADGYPEPDALRAVVKQGALATADHRGYGDPTEGSDWIVRCARRDDPRPLDILIWGGIDDLAQALHDAPDILPRLRVHYIGGPNKLWGVDAYDYVETHHPELSIIESNSTYRGFFADDGSGDHQVRDFIGRHAAGHGALGDFFARQLPAVKMGDSPTVTWLLHGSQDPARASWGGRYVPLWGGRKTIFERHTTAADVAEVYGVVEFLLPKPAGYGPGDTARMIIDGRRQGPFATAVAEGDRLRFRCSPRDPKIIPYLIESSHPDLDGRAGAVTAAPPPEDRWRNPSAAQPHWWCDDQDPAAALGPLPGARTISEWRDEFLADFALRLDRCRPAH